MSAHTITKQPLSRSFQEKIALPRYTLGEELWNAISHGMGAVYGIVIMILCILKSAHAHNTAGIVASSIYGASLILLYTVSCIYHSLKRNKAKRVFRILDHCSIFLLIAGTYTPFTLVTLPSGIGYTIFGIIWGFAILGIILNAIDVKRFSKFSMICYLGMGWLIVFAFPALRASLAPTGIDLLLQGGLAYTLGTITYGIGSKVRYMHSIWHFFVLAGSILHSLAIYLYVL